jgi:hypothetical protein
MHANIGETAGFDGGQCFCHAVDEGLTANEADARMRFGLRNQILAAAESDLEPHIVERNREQAHEFARRRHVEVECEARQQIFKQPRLMRTQTMTLAAAEEAAPEFRLFISGRHGAAITRGTIARRDGCQETAPRIASTRSVFSQENPPSGSGERPKWP